MDLSEVERRYCAETALRHFRGPGINYVPGRGNEHSPTFFVVGEAPGATENLKRKPFVGQSGYLLTQLMGIAGLSADPIEYGGGDFSDTDPGNVWLTNVVKFRPPGNRTPTDAEVAASLPYLRMEWAAVGRPRVLVAVGATAWRALSGGRLGNLTKVAGQGFLLNDGKWLWAMVHPAYALRNFSYRPTMEKHWEIFAAWRERMGPDV